MPSAFSNKLLRRRAVASPACAVVAPADGRRAAPRRGGAAFEPPPPPPERAKLVDGRAGRAGLGAHARQARDRGGQPASWRSRTSTAAATGPYASGRLDRGYDCSGAVRYALYGGRFLRSPLPSGALMSWGQQRPGPLDHRVRARRPRLRRGGRAAASTPRCATPTPRARAPARAGARRSAARPPSWRATRAATEPASAAVHARGPPVSSLTRDRRHRST